MMRNLPAQRAGVRLSGDGSSFKKAEPLPEGIRVLPDDEVRSVFSSLFRRNFFDSYARFTDARSKLRELFGATIEVVDEFHGGLKVAARLEFLTTDRTIDEDLHHRVAGMGFDLTLRSVPVTGVPEFERYEARCRFDSNGEPVIWYEPATIRTYIISEGRYSSADLMRAPQSAEGLLRLAHMLRPAGIHEDVPDNLVDLSKARTSKPPAAAPAASSAEARSAG
ncbi:MAG: hypothetical protein AB1529_03065 [Candidatus Micrarchaeota archaeon]